MSELILSNFDINHAKLIAHNHYPPRWGKLSGKTSVETFLYFHPEHGYLVEKNYSGEIAIRQVSTADARSLFAELVFHEVKENYEFVAAHVPVVTSPAAITYTRGDAVFYENVQRALNSGRMVHVYNAPEMGLYPLLARNGIKAQVTFVSGFHVLEPERRVYGIRKHKAEAR